MSPLARAVSVDDVRDAARHRLPRAVFDFFDGGAETETSLRRNRSQFDAVAFRHRVLSDVSVRDQSVVLFGRRHASPFGIGPTGLAGLAWPGAEALLARAAARAGVPFTLSTVASTSVEAAGRAGSGAKWFQLYILKDRGLSRELARRAYDAGFEALVITADCPVGGKRERDPRNHFTLPLRPTARTVLDFARRPGWLAGIARHGVPRAENMAAAASEAGAPDLAAFMNAQLDPAVTWRDVEAFRELWGGTLIVKGVLHVDDARRAAALGADGVVVSNHGGRQLDGAAPVLNVLPEIAEAVGDALTVLCDSGFRRGSDIVKALALGARAVLLGRATLYGVAAAGEAGATHVLDILRDEVDRVLALLGCSSVAALGAAHLVECQEVLKVAAKERLHVERELLQLPAR